MTMVNLQRNGIVGAAISWVRVHTIAWLSRNPNPDIFTRQ